MLRNRSRLAATGAILLAAGGLLRPALAGPARTPEIKALEEAIRQSDAPDSLKLALAVAHRKAGTIEDRYRALELLEQVRRTYDTDPEYHWEYARTYKAAARYMDARRALDRVLELRPGDVEARVEKSRLLLRELLYSYDLSYAKDILAELDQALALDPDHRDALFLKSLTLHLARGMPSADPLPMTYEGKACAQRILDHDPEDLDARFLLAIHCLDLNEIDRADEEFKECINEAPAPVQEAFITSASTGHSGIVKYARDLPPEERRSFHLSYWRHYDPTPLTVANENQLEFWKRMALAEFFFGDPETGVRGWDTDPGRTLVRYGMPRTRAFDPGDVTSSGDHKFDLKFVPPSWSWSYRFRDRAFTLRFEDRGLQGKFTADDRTAKTLIALRNPAPVVFHEAAPGAIQDLYMTSAGVAGRDGTVQQSVYVGLPPWRDDRKTDWLEDSRFEMLVRDSTYTQIFQSKSRIRPENIYRPFPGTEILLFSHKYDLPPGRYTVSAYVEDKDSEQHGALTRPLVVRDYEAEPGLSISDLELALALTPDLQGPRLTKLGQSYLPNPMGLVGDSRNLNVFYEIYHLATERQHASYLLRYTILPLAYVVGFDYHVTHGRASRDDLVPFAERGVAIGKVELSPADYSDIKFPRETVAVDGAGRAVKGASLDLHGLGPGRYVLVVTVTDGINQATARAEAPFQILTDDGLRELLAVQGGG